jgi:hypothetical protein
MGFFPSQGGNSHERDHNAEPYARVGPPPPTRKRLSTSLAAQRQQIAGVQHLQPRLEKIERLQRELREAGEALGAILGSAPLAKAYTQFQDQGGITAADWQDWLAGKTLSRNQHRSKRHLRLVVYQDEAPSRCRIGSGGNDAA